MRLLRVILLLFIPVIAYSGEISIEGTYQGENLYVNNPNAESGVGFCVYEVMVNGMTSTDEINSNSFEIDLGVYRFAIGDPLEVVIKYKEGCVPRVINPEVIAPRASFKTLDIAVKDGELRWKTTGESGSLPYIVEQFRWNKWIQVGQVKGEGVPGTHQYGITVRLHSGENRFRVRQSDDQNNRKYTPEVHVTVDKPQVALASNRVENQLVFSEPTLYEIYDIYGRIVVKGYNDSVNVDNLSNGDYYLNFANQMSMFSKR